jgi:hypothetical protein
MEGMKVRIEQGICGFVTHVEAISEDGEEVAVKVDSGCGHVMKMFEELGDTFDSYELCFQKPGCGPLYDYASKHFPVHCGCVAVAGVVKAVEAECKLALPKDASIIFE